MAINLDAHSVRSEVFERMKYDETVTPEQHAKFNAMSDERIENAIHGAIDDHFWNAYDSARSDAITALIGED